jgi:hypothetical protein
MKFRDYIKEQNLPLEGRTTRDFNHFHAYQVDVDGVGETTSMVGDYEDHMHPITNWKVIVDGHTHFIVGTG